MLNSKILLASKATSSYCKNKYKTKPKKLCQFEYNVDDLAPGDATLLPQRHRYSHEYYKRQPLFQAGVGVHMHPKTYTLKSKNRGVMSIRRSVVNDTYKWVEMDHDIHKVHCTNFMKEHYKARNAAMQYNPTNNNVRQEYHVMRHLRRTAGDAEAMAPRFIHTWHQSVLREPHALERFQDPNMLHKCPEKLNGPVIRPQYVWD